MHACAAIQSKTYQDMRRHIKKEVSTAHDNYIREILYISQLERKPKRFWPYT